MCNSSFSPPPPPPPPQPQEEFQTTMGMQEAFSTNARDGLTSRAALSNTETALKHTKQSFLSFQAILCTRQESAKTYCFCWTLTHSQYKAGQHREAIFGHKYWSVNAFTEALLSSGLWSNSWTCTVGSWVLTLSDCLHNAV